MQGAPSHSHVRCLSGRDEDRCLYELRSRSVASGRIQHVLASAKAGYTASVDRKKGISALGGRPTSGLCQLSICTLLAESEQICFCALSASPCQDRPISPLLHQAPAMLLGDSHLHKLYEPADVHRAPLLTHRRTVRSVNAKPSIALRATAYRAPSSVTGATELEALSALSEVVPDTWSVW